MDIFRILQELHAERAKVNNAIQTLEQLKSGRSLEEPKSRRGRKSMSEEERLAVSERMRKYWEQRRSSKRS